MAWVRFRASNIDFSGDFKVISATNGIVGLRAGGSSLLVMANYRRKAVTLPKGTILGIAELYEEDILTPDEEGQEEPLEVLAVAETTELEEPDAGKPNKSPAPACIPPKDQEDTKALGEADHDHLPCSVADGVRRMLIKYDVMWTGGALGTIAATQHRVDLAPGARPAQSQPHRAGPMQR